MGLDGDGQTLGGKQCREGKGGVGGVGGEGDGDSSRGSGSHVVLGQIDLYVLTRFWIKQHLTLRLRGGVHKEAPTTLWVQ